MSIPCSQRTFPLSLKPLLSGVLTNYTAWLHYLSERLGPSEARALWEAALERYELPLLDSILASGWTPVEEAEVHSDDDQASPDDRDVSYPEIDDTPDSQALALVRDAPPIAQIRSRFADLNVQRETTAYETLHLALHGRALVAEALLDEYGKQGEFIAYDIVKERRCAAVPVGGVTISEFMGGNEYSPGTRNMFTAGLEVETISTSLTEDVFRVHHCEWARYFREKHPRVGYLMACSTDEAFARASNPALRLQRTSTLMEGGDFCDFRYYAVEEDPS